MFERKKEYPRYWPILFILNKLSSLNNHFFLQKYIFLAKIEGKIPIDYIFIKETYGPYCIDIKQDARELNNNGLITMIWDPDRSRWNFEIVERHKVEIEEIINDIPDKWKRKFDSIMDKYTKYSRRELEEYVYKHHVRSKEKNEQILSNIKSTAQKLEKLTENYPPNYNSFLLQGVVDYCLLALRKINPSDIIQQDYLLRSIYNLLSSVGEITELVSQNPECLAKMDLRDIEEEFELTQEVCKEVGNLPTLEEMDLSLLKA